MNRELRPKLHVLVLRCKTGIKNMFYSRSTSALSACVVFLIAVLLSLPFSASARDGDLDKSFDAVLSQSRNSPGVNHVFPLPDSRILVAGGFKVVNGVTK